MPVKTNFISSGYVPDDEEVIDEITSAEEDRIETGDEACLSQASEPEDDSLEDFFDDNGASADEEGDDQ
jgi:hypothetical protein